MPDRRYGRLALVLTGVFGLASVFYWFFALTFGLISGLVALMAPAYPVFVQLYLLVLVVCLGLWRGHPRVATVAALVVALAPPLAAAVAYALAKLRCGPDPACHAYLDDHHVLPALVGLVGVIGVGEAVVVGLFAWERTHRTSRRIA